MLQPIHIRHILCFFDQDGERLQLRRVVLVFDEYLQLLRVHELESFVGLFGVARLKLNVIDNLLLLVADDVQRHLLFHGEKVALD